MKCMVVPLQRSDQFIHCEVNMVDAKTKFLVTFIYALNLPSEREPLWADMLRNDSSVALPWLILGDLNTTLFYDEKVKGGTILDSDTAELSTFVQEAEVMDLRYTGKKLTWCNNHDGLDRLYCKLYRALINNLWLDVFGNSEARFLERSSSDHSACVANLHVDLPKGKHIFRYCNFWSSDEKFLDIVQRAWQQNVQWTPMFILVQKLKGGKAGT